MKALHTLLLLLPFFLLTAAPVHADQIFRVSPVIIPLTLSPDKTFGQEIIIENLTDLPLPLRINLTDFQTTGEDGGYNFAETRTDPLLSWIKLSETELILKPKEKKKLPLTITTPKRIALGGYYGMLFFEPALATTQGTKINSKIGVLLLANIGVPDHNAKQADILTLEQNLFNQSTLPLLLRVQNISLHYFTAKPIIRMTPLIPFPTASETTEYLEEKIIFPGKVRRWEQALTPALVPNIYKMHVTISTGTGNTTQTEKYIVVLPNNTILIGVAIICLVLLLFAKRKQLHKAWRALTE